MASTWYQLQGVPWEIRPDGPRPVGPAHPRLLAYLAEVGLEISELPELQLPPMTSQTPAELRASLYREKCDPLLASALAYQRLGDPREGEAWLAWEIAREEIQAAHPDPAP